MDVDWLDVDWLDVWFAAELCLRLCLVRRCAPLSSSCTYSGPSGASIIIESPLLCVLHLSVCF
jgi:hypothetical protein